MNLVIFTISFLMSNENGLTEFSAYENSECNIKRKKQWHKHKVKPLLALSASFPNIPSLSSFWCSKVPDREHWSYSVRKKRFLKKAPEKIGAKAWVWVGDVDFFGNQRRAYPNCRAVRPLVGPPAGEDRAERKRGAR